MTVTPYKPPTSEQSDVGQRTQLGPTMTKAAWAQGSRNAMLCLIPVVAVTCLAYLFVSKFTNSTLVAGSAAFTIPFAACLLWMLMGWWRGIKSRGVLLLDCGAHPARSLFLLNALILAAWAVFGGFWPFRPFALVFAAYWLFMASGRLAVHESGLWVYHGLVPWEKISEYSWTSNTLMVKTAGLLSFFRGALPIPVEDVDDVERLIEEHMPPEAS